VAARKASEQNSAHLSTAGNKPPKKKHFNKNAAKSKIVWERTQQLAAMDLAKYSTQCLYIIL